jgi:hypothetical protein
MPDQGKIATPDTRRKAIESLQRHIFEVEQGKVRMDMTPQEIDEYLNAEYSRLTRLRAMGLRI